MTEKCKKKNSNTMSMYVEAFSSRHAAKSCYILNEVYLVPDDVYRARGDITLNVGPMLLDQYASSNQTKSLKGS